MMDAVRLRFADHDRADRPLSVGVHGIGRRPQGGIEVVEGDADSPVRLCVDRRGMWLTVGEGAGGVHVNGRSVRRMAMLRVGDAVYVDGSELRLVSSRPVRTPDDLDPGSTDDDSQNLRVVLRGVGGRFHGRCFTLDRPRLVGRHAEADIRIDDPAFADRHARLELAGDDVVLRDLGSAEGSVVNGQPVRDAVLEVGDQVVFDGQHRFVIEAPQRRRSAAGEGPQAAMHPAATAQALVDDTAVGRGGSTLPWLLLAALGIALLLAALLLFGSG